MTRDQMLAHLRAADEVAREAARHGHHPFGAVLVGPDDRILMRQGNILRQMGKSGQALALSEREIAAARASQNGITLARSLMSNGTNQIVAGQAGKAWHC